MMGDGDDPAKEVLDTPMTVTFNGAKSITRRSSMGEVSATTWRHCRSGFAQEPATGALSVFSDDREIQRDLAAIFRDVVLAADGAIGDMPMLEFDLSAFVSPTVLAKLVSDGSGASSVSTFSTSKVACPSLRKTHDEAGDREIVQELEKRSDGFSRPSRRREYLRVARQDYQKPRSVRLCAGADQAGDAHGQTAASQDTQGGRQVTAPNGFNDRNKTGMIASWSWPIGETRHGGQVLMSVRVRLLPRISGSTGRSQRPGKACLRLPDGEGAETISCSVAGYVQHFVPHAPDGFISGRRDRGRRRDRRGCQGVPLSQSLSGIRAF